jgi:hypothetical protein
MSLSIGLLLLTGPAPFASADFVVLEDAIDSLTSVTGMLVAQGLPTGTPCLQAQLSISLTCTGLLSGCTRRYTPSEEHHHRQCHQRLGEFVHQC